MGFDPKKPVIKWLESYRSAQILDQNPIKKMWQGPKRRNHHRHPQNFHIFFFQIYPKGQKTFPLSCVYNDKKLLDGYQRCLVEIKQASGHATKYLTTRRAYIPGEYMYRKRYTSRASAVAKALLMQ